MTIALATFRRFPWKKVPIYIAAQLLGAFVGAALTYANYFHAIDVFEGGKGVRTTPGTAALFATYAVCESFLDFRKVEVLISGLSLIICPQPHASLTKSSARSSLYS